MIVVNKCQTYPLLTVITGGPVRWPGSQVREPGRRGARVSW